MNIIIICSNSRDVSIRVEAKAFWGIHQGEGIDVISVLSHSLTLGDLVACWNNQHWLKFYTSENITNKQV